MVSLKFREFLPGYVGEEFDSLVAQLRGFFSVSFNEDGTLTGVDNSLRGSFIGQIAESARSTTPAGWLVCDGGAISRVTYKALFEVIGTDWGAGDGSTTFNKPDLRGRFLLGKAASGTGSTLGETGGSIDHVHAGGAHTHSISSDGGHAHTVDSHTHTIATHTDLLTGGVQSALNVIEVAVDLSSSQFAADAAHVHAQDPTTHNHDGVTGAASPGMDTQGAHNHAGATGNASGDTGSANPPYAVVNVVIYAGA